MLKKLAHIIFAFAVLFSSTGFTLHTHICGEEVQEISIKKVKSCCTPDEGEENDCCRNEAEIQQIEDDFVGANILELSPLLITFFDIPDYLALPEDQDSYIPQYKNYKPPLLDLDIPVDIQTFLC